MKCWRCGEEYRETDSKCIACGIRLNRIVPVTEEGKALRILFDRYGGETVLTNTLLITNGLGDLLPNNKKTRNQIKLSFDCGIGRIYLAQIKSSGIPDSLFKERIRTYYTDEIGLTDKTAEKLTAIMDEMIGWSTSDTNDISSSQSQSVSNSDDQKTIDELLEKANGASDPLCHTH